jgi:glucokinase
MGELLVGIDIGGTKIAVSAGDLAGRVTAHTRRPTAGSGDPRQDVAAIADDVRRVVAESGRQLADVAAIGVSAPGPLDATGTRVVAPPNLDGWDDVPLVDWLRDELGAPVYLENDANAAAVAEWRFGAGRGFQDVVYLTMSTGVGGGLILGGRLYRGVGRTAGEVGHARVSWEADAQLCGCGARGCLEAYVGGASWSRHLRETASPESRMAELAGGVAQLGPRQVVAAAREGDTQALAEMARYNRYLARGIANLCFVLAPEVVVLGTIPVAAGEELCFAPVREMVRELLWDAIERGVQIVPAQLGEDLPDQAGLGVALDAIEAAAE